MMKDILDLLGKTYGPYAFGIISLLIIWWVMLKPLLDKQALDFEAQRKIIELQNASLADQRQISENMRQTAAIMDKLMSKLEAQK